MTPSLPSGGRKKPKSLPFHWPEREYWESEVKFHPERKWRFDFCYPALKIAVEQEGGVWVGGRHTSGAGFVKDMEKYNAAGALGWRIFRFTPWQMKSGEASTFMRNVLEGKG